MDLIQQNFKETDMTSGFDEMRRAKEESYFDRKNREALERLSQKSHESQPRMSPVTGKPMIQEAFHGVVIDRCPDSGGIWLDAGELEEIYQALKQQDTASDSSWVTNFFQALSGKPNK